MNVTLINGLNQQGLILEKIEEKDSIVKKTLLDLGGIIDGTFTFGTGITAMLPAVKELMSGNMPNITEQDIILLYITAMWILVGKHKDKIEKLLNIIRERGLTDGLSVVLDFLKSVENIALKIGNSLGYTANSLADIVAFTFLAFPILDGIIFLMNQGLIHPGSPTGYLKSILVGVGIIGFKNIFNHIIKKLGGKLKPLDKGQENLNEQSDFYKETLEMVEDVMSLVKKSTTNPDIETYYLPEDLRPDEIIYEIDNYMFTVELTISRDEGIKDEFHLEAYYAGDDTIEIGLIINPLREPESYTHIEDYLTEYIRHEIRHAEQEVMGTNPRKGKKGLKGLPYYTQDHEIDAQTSGLNARKIKQGRSFEEVIRGSVENTKLRHGLSDEEGEQLYDILLKDITERYGKESLQESKDLNKNMTLDVGDEIIVIHKSIGSPKHMELFKPYVVTGWNFGVRYHPKMPKSGLTDYDKRVYNIMPIDGDGPEVTMVGDGSDEWILRPGFRRGEDLYEQSDNGANIRKKVVLDNEDYRIYVPLNKDGICNIPNTKYCESNQILKLQASVGTPYIIEFKKDSSPVKIGGPKQLLLIDRGKIPFLREPKSQKSMYNTKAMAENLKELLSQEKELQKFFHLKYSLPERIKYNMEFDEDVLLDGKEHSKLGNLIYNINNNTGDPEELVDYFGDFEEYSESYYTRGGEDEIEIVPDGINVYLKKDDWLQNVLEMGDGEYYYNLVHDYGYGYNDYDEIDSDELNYMSCWFNNIQLRKVTELMNLMEGTDKPIDRQCHEFEEGEINDFFEKYFPEEWGNHNGDILYEVGKGIGENRVKEMKEWFENEIYLDYDHIGNDSVRINIGWEPLLYLVTNHLQDTDTLDTLFSQSNAINSISSEPQDVYYDSYDWSEGTEENVASEIDRFLEKIDDVDIERRKDFIKKVNDFLNKERFESHNWGVHKFTKKYGEPNRPDRKVSIRKIDTENETINFDVEVREYVGNDSRLNRENYVKSFEDFARDLNQLSLF